MNQSFENTVIKYNVPGPRYTSYPPVPEWNKQFTEEAWLNEVASAGQTPISMYIHLPYCESLCTYCGCNKRITKNHYVEIPYIFDLLKELAYYNNKTGIKFELSNLHFGGGTPTFFSPENLYLLVKGLLKENRVSPDHSFSFEAHPANTTADHIKTLKDLGFNRLSLGVQDFNPIVQKAIHRYQTVEDVASITKLARNNGYQSVNFDLIYGLPFQTVQSISHSFEKVLAIRPDRIAFYSYAHVPWKSPSQRGYSEKDLPSAEEKLELYFKGKELLEAEGYIQIGMDHFALPTDDLYKAQLDGTLNRNFMGYTEHKTNLLLGLGASSISESPGMYVQNEKVIETYSDAISEEKLPFINGHTLTESEKILKFHITELMCQLQTDVEEVFKIADNKEFIQSQINDLIADELVQLNGYQLTMTSHGKHLIRPACMALDFIHSGWRNNEQVNRYSKLI